MGIKYYKLTEYKPFWIYADNKYPRKHIEQIVLETQSVLWEDVKNFQWIDIDNLTATGYAEDIPDYVKVDVNGVIYYYYLLNKSAILASKDGKTQYRAVYELDEYMTSHWYKLEILREHNPSVYVNMGFKNRWNDRRDTNNDIEYYEIDYIKQRHLSNTIADRNAMMVRKLAYSTTAQDIYSLNFPDEVIPSTYTINQYDDSSKSITLSNFSNKLTTANSRGRYLYYIAKSSAKMKSNNSELLSSHTDQQFIIIPFFAGSEDEIFHGLNDFDKTSTGDGFLVPQGDNEIGLWECDIPYSYFYGLVAKGLYGAKIEYAAQKMSSDTYINIPFFTINNNAPMILKIIDYAKYGEGFYGKFLYMINNIYYWTPETEPALWNPTYYKEIYNNGESEISIDASMFSFKWNSQTIDEFGVSAYLSLSSSLILAYNFGANTNKQLATFDNTETSLGSASITNMYMGSNSANYYTTNSSTIATSIANRKSEEAQAWTDAALSTAKIWNNAAPDSLGEVIFNTGKVVKRAVNAALDTAKIMTDTALTQQRANRDFVGGVNNMTTSPNQTLSSGSVKGVIPNKTGLFETYSKELHPSDKRVIFTNYLHNGYPINEVMQFNEVANNRKFMNILNLNTQYFTDDLMKLLTENDTTIFNNKFWNKRFLAFINNSISIYETTRLINCTDYMGEDYVSNVEYELPDIPRPKTNIARYITNFRYAYEANYDFIANALQEDNPQAEEQSDIWDSIIVEQMEFGGFIITAIDGTDYYGSIVVDAVCYNGYILEEDTGNPEENTIPDAVYHYFWDVNFLCVPEGEQAKPFIIRCPDGTLFENMTFNEKIVFIDNGTLTSIGDRFMEGAYIDENYSLFNQDITLPNTITHIGYSFMRDRGNMIGTIDFQNIPSNVFDLKQDEILLRTPSTLLLTQFGSAVGQQPISWNSVPAYANGVKIKGTYADDILNILPNGTYSFVQYYGARKLVKVEETSKRKRK